MFDPISKKIYLQMSPPTEETDARSDQHRIQETLREEHQIDAVFRTAALRKLYPVCEDSGYQVTVTLAWDGSRWMVADVEKGDTTAAHYGYAIDLGSTTIVGRLINCSSGEILAEATTFNREICHGMDILDRIFYTKNSPEHREEMRQLAVESLLEVTEELKKMTGIGPEACIQMVIGGNTTMIHFLLGMDAFCVFASPYAVRSSDPGFLPANEVGIPVSGYVYPIPGLSNYLGGDIISGMIATEMYRSRELCAFFDIGTNGELVVGNQDFLLCGAGAAGPALEGAVVRTGMKASPGAVEHLSIRHGQFELDVIGGKNEVVQGICGSGIVDMLAELFLWGWIDIRGQFVPEKSPLIHRMRYQNNPNLEDEYAVEYAEGLYFWQSDVDEFIRTKAAAHTMVHIMLQESGLGLEQMGRFYVCGSFGKHVSKESAIAIGMYPDMNREAIVNAGNTSLDGAQKVLLQKAFLEDIPEILEKMTYIQYGAVPNFLEIMIAAQALPHTNMDLYPTVAEKLRQRGTMREQ